MGKKKPLIERVIQSYPQYTKEEAFALILSGNVFCSEEKNRNPKQLVSADAAIAIHQRSYVSRGGFKLKKAVDFFGLDCQNKVVLDGGASTGGFTDCLLQQGARTVFAVDVGFNQLAFKLRQDSRVVVMEKTNVKDLKELTPTPDFAVADLSFRSVVPVLQKLLGLTKERHLVCLLKPQFELDPSESISFSGVVKEVALLERIVKRFFLAVEKEGVVIAGFTESPILGSKGNREFLVNLYLQGNEPERKTLGELHGILEELLQNR